MSATLEVLGLTGRKLSGKDTFYGIVQASAPPWVRVQRLAFADFLKEEVARACHVTVEEINRDKVAFRPILQWWGTDFRRNRYGDRYWVDQVTLALRRLDDGETPTLAVLTDVRFPNEAALVQEVFHGKLFRLVRPQSETPDPHPSETAMDGYPVNAVILNDGCLSALQDYAAWFWSVCSIVHTMHQ